MKSVRASNIRKRSPYQPREWEMFCPVCRQIRTVKGIQPVKSKRCRPCYHASMRKSAEWKKGDAYPVTCPTCNQRRLIIYQVRALTSSGICPDCSSRANVLAAQRAAFNKSKHRTHSLFLNVCPGCLQISALTYTGNRDRQGNPRRCGSCGKGRGKRPHIQCPAKNSNEPRRIA
jgi:Zn finger protein HypA/HybF involved in hydrogenase expression